jgi:ABC-type multidrug transport system ATPase subunit
LSGNISSHNSEVSGDIWYNNTIIEQICILPPWQRCAYVDSCLEVTRDLSVKEVVTFAMRLRCGDDTAFELIEENVSRTIGLLNLTDKLDVKTKALSNAELRLVTIAEEIVSGSSLLFLDEPLTGLSIKEQSIVMKSFREMVSRDKTVVATFREPSNEVFDLFDHLIFISKGSIVYEGPAKDAFSFFSSQYSHTMDTAKKLTKAAYLIQAADNIPASSDVVTMDNSSLNQRKNSTSAALTNPLLVNESAVTITTSSAGDSTLLGGRNVRMKKCKNLYTTILEINIIFFFTAGNRNEFEKQVFKF